jgi:hypothetical protein
LLLEKNKDEDGLCSGDGLCRVRVLLVVNDVLRLVEFVRNVIEDERAF